MRWLKDCLTSADLRSVTFRFCLYRSNAERNSTEDPLPCSGKKLRAVYFPLDACSGDGTRTGLLCGSNHTALLRESAVWPTVRFPVLIP